MKPSAKLLSVEELSVHPRDVADVLTGALVVVIPFAAREFDFVKNMLKLDHAFPDASCGSKLFVREYVSEEMSLGIRLELLNGVRVNNPPVLVAELLEPYEDFDDWRPCSMCKHINCDNDRIEFDYCGKTVVARFDRKVEQEI